MIASASESSKRAKRLIYTYLRRYWQGGQIKNALIPHYHKSGGKGKERQVKDRKRGRPRGVAQETQTPEMQTSMGAKNVAICQIPNPARALLRLGRGDFVLPRREDTYPARISRGCR